jgi:hypothetical protein
MHPAAVVEAEQLTLTLSPSLTTSLVFCTRFWASWLMWTRPGASLGPDLDAICPRPPAP